MAQNFRNALTRNIGIAYADILPEAAVDSYDAIIGIRLANVSGESITVSVKLVRSATDYYIIKNVEILQGQSLELIDGGSKIVLHDNDKIQAISNAVTSLDCILSYIDLIST